MFPVLLFQIPLTAEEQEVEEKVEEEVQKAPKEQTRKLQAYDRKSQPHYKGVSEAASMGRKAALVALGLEPKSV